MSSLKIVEFIYRMSHLGIRIWAQDEEVAVFVPEDVTFNDVDKEFFSNNSDSILDCLKVNNILSKDDHISILHIEEEKLPLSFAQERMIFIDRYEEGTKAYNIPMVFRLGKNTNFSVLEASVKDVVKRHSVLRTIIKADDNGINYQCLIDCKNLPLQIINYTCSHENEFMNILNNELYHIFDLSNDYPIRVCLYHLHQNRENYISIVVHHISFDRWSMNIFQEELEQLYDYNLYLKKYNKKTLSLKRQDVDYRDFVVWQKAYLNDTNSLDKLNFWKNKLAGFKSLNLTSDRNRLSNIDYNGDLVSFNIDHEVSCSLRNLAKTLGISLFCIFLTGFYLLLKTFSNQEDFVIGTPMANRGHKELEGIIGLFINTVVLRATINREERIKNLFKRVSSEIIEAQSYQDLQFEKLINELLVEKDSSRHPIFQVMFNFDTIVSYSTNKKSNKILYEYAPDKLKYKVAKFDFTAYIIDKGETIEGIFNYATSIYNQETINGFIVVYKKILKQFSKLSKSTNNPKLKELSMNLCNEYQTSLPKRDFFVREITTKDTLIELFEKQVENNSNRVALICEDMHFTYGSLNEKANNLGNYLKEECRVKREDKVGLYLPKNEYTLIAILGVLKVGACYVPMAHIYPKERIEYIVNDADCKVILCEKKDKEKLIDLAGKNRKIVTINCNELWHKINTYNGYKPEVIVSDDNLAYIIYTSGTTGQPKGVMQLNNNVIRLFSATKKIYNFSGNDIWILFHSYIFDFTVWEIWGALLYGAKLVVPCQEDILEFLHELCRKHRVTVLNQTPLAFYQFINPCINNDRLNDLRYVVFGGEALNIGKLRSWIDYYGYTKPRLINMYGITETTVHTTYKELENKQESTRSIGKSLSDLKIYILSNELDSLPIGVVGEICVIGEGLARGYINRPELTAEKFVANPFATEEDIKRGYSRLYRTGDLGRYLPDGNIEYIGRNDEQVKIRGFRIELGEIESVLQSYDGISQSVVVAKSRESGDKYLVGYYVGDAVLKEESIESYLSKKLPDYMVPSKLLRIEEIPLTVNGKIDRKSLPEVNFVDKDNYIAPRNEIERRMCEIWEEILGLEKVGIKDDFFKLGGDSIVAIRLISLLNNRLELAFKVRDIFSYKCILALREVERKEHRENESYTRFSLVSKKDFKEYENNDSIEDVYPATALQSGMLIKSDLNDFGAYHDVFSYKLNTQFNQKKILDVWKKLISKNELLRAAFVINNLNLNVVIYKTIAINLTVFKNKDIKEVIESERKRDFKISEPGLFRLIINDFGNQFNLVFSFHHSIADGWSVSSLINDFIQSYVNNYYIKYDCNLRYGEFVREELRIIKNKKFEDFWKKYLYDANCTKFYNSSSIIDYTESIQNFRFIFDRKISDRISAISLELGITPDNVFLFVYLKVLSCFTNSKDITIGLVENNRLEKIGGDKLFGLFLNTIPFRFKIECGKKVNQFVRVFNEKIKLQKYKNLPYSHLKSIFKEDLYYFAFNYVNYHILDNSEEFIQEYEGYERTDIPFILDIGKLNNGSYICNINSIDNHINSNFLKYFASIYKGAFEYLLNDSNTNSILSDKESQRQLFVWNNTQRDFKQKSNILERFENYAEEVPERVSLVYEGVQLTYDELNKRSNRLASYLISKGVSTDSLVSLCIDRSDKLLLSILGVWKSGGGYVPVDSKYPDERISYILSDTQCKVVLCNEEYRSRIERLSKELNLPVIVESIDSKEMLAKLSHESIENPLIPLNDSNIAYVIYTSGTTGNPKGVGITHSGLENRIKWMNEQYPLRSNDKILQKTPYTFDVSVWELLWSICYGACTVFAKPGGHRDSDYIKDISRKEQITIMHFVPSMLIAYVGVLDRSYKHNLRYLFCSGEELKPSVLKESYKKLGEVEIHNLYGPTEASIDVLHYGCVDRDTSNVYIGKPISNIQTYILSDDINLLPIGSVGEIYIGGIGLARGYINRPGLTAEKFIANPFATEEDIKRGCSRLYRTGDLGRYLPDGNIEYIGRNDEQVKIRGFRIELGEIESVLQSYDGISQSVVVTKSRESGDKYLVGYYVGDVGLKEEDIESYLSKKLPDYMVPSKLLCIEEIPLTANGKINRKALPEVDFVDKDNYVAPRNEIERCMCEIWEEVLGLEKVGIKDDFFKLGGHSLLVIHMVSSIRDSIKVDIKFKDIFQCPILEDLCKRLDLDNVKLLPSITKASDSEKIPLSFSQQRLWFIEQLTGQSSLYHVPLYLLFYGRLNIDVLEKSLNFLVNRHQILRTVIVSRDEVPYQSVLPDDTKFSLIYIHEKDKASVNERIMEFVEDPFNFGNQALCRGIIIRQEEEKYILALNFHHIIVDDWSINLFKKELFKCYNSFVNGYKPELPQLKFQYKDFTSWQKNLIATDIFSKQLEYWKKNLQDIQNLNIPIDKPRPKEQSFLGDTYDYKLDKNILSKVKALSISENVTTFVVLITVFKAFLSKEYNQQDIVIGTPIANRRTSETAGMMGLFLNTLALRVRINGNPRFKELLHKVKEEFYTAFDNQDIPFEHIIDHLKIDRDLSRHPVFQVMFVFQKLDGEQIKLPNLELSEYKIIRQDHAKFEVTFSILETPDGLNIEVNYAKSLYSRETIKKIAIGYKVYLERVLNDINIRLSDLDVSNKKEKDVIKWNGKQNKYFTSSLLHSLFEEQASKNPDRIAIKYKNNQLTYAEVNNFANQLSRHILELGVKTNTLIGVCIFKTHDVLSSLLSILKLGNGYVPIDPEYPEYRIKSILEDSGIKVVITSKELERVFKNLPVKVIFVEDKLKLCNFSKNNITHISVSSNNIAYVIYTSGSTGKPKGVMINHNSVVNTINSINEKLKCDEQDKILSLSELGFDLSVYDYFGVAAAGGTIIVPDIEKSKEPSYWLDMIFMHSVSIWDSVPQLAQLLIDNYENIRSSKIALQNIAFLLSGDRIPVNLPKQIKEKFSNANILSLGGATEGSIWSIWYDTENLCPDKLNIPYGKSMPNQSMYVLDRFGSHCVVGVVGDIYIGGKGLALGYYNMPTKTAETFIANPFFINEGGQDNYNCSGSRIYKTGDIGKYLLDGNIEYVGRNDFQIKVRGFRIELGEIEKVITSVVGVRQSVVIVSENEMKTKKLVAYFVLDNKHNDYSVSDIVKFAQEACKNFLPEYMQPSDIIALENMPLSVNGKIARDELPQPQVQEKNVSYNKPKGKEEEKLAEIWRLLLGVKKVGRNDNFFNLGGDSIISIQMVSRAKKVGLFFDIKQIFYTPTIAELVKNSQKKNTQDISKRYEASGKLKLLPIQQWFFKNFKNYNHFNQAFWFSHKKNLDTERIKKIVQEVRSHHEAFKLRYICESDRWIGNYNERKTNMLFEVIDKCLTDNELNSIVTNKQKSLDIKNGPIDSLLWVKDRGLLWIMHHLIVDGVSWRILLQDINNLYNGKSLNAKSDTYKSWSEYIHHYDKLTNAVHYYNQLNYHQLNYDNGDRDEEVKQQEVIFSKEVTNLFLGKTHKSYNTQANDLLLLALLLSIGDVQGQYKITIMLEGHGRDGLESNLDLTRTIGWFTTMFPVELMTNHSNDLSSSIKEVKEILRKVPDQGLSYGIANIKQKIQPGKVDILFNYLGQLDAGENNKDDFVFGALPVGETVGDRGLKYALEINGYVAARQLHFIWKHTSKLTSSTIKKFILQFEKRLIQIVKHCAGQQEINYTPSDFAAASLDQEELDEILKIYDNEKKIDKNKNSKFAS